MGKMGSACCKCIHPCGKYCIISNAISTTLTIVGNHPAELVIPISYDISNDTIFGSANCRIEGKEDVDETASTNPWSVECRYVREGWYDGIGVLVEKCCDPDWVDLFNGSIETLLKTSTRISANHKYVKSKVRVRAGTKVIDGESVCGVYVTVCLIFARQTITEFYTCGRTTVTGTLRSPTTLFDTSCCAESDEMLSVDETLSFNSPDATATGCNPDAAFDAGGYVNIPPCDDDADPFADYEPDVLLQYLHQITREVFLPNSDSIGCDPFVVSLTPADTISEDCGDVLGTVPSDPDPVYWEWDACSYEDDDPRIPAPSVVETLCGSNSTSPAHYALFWDACDTSGSGTPRNILLNNVDLPSVCATDASTLQGILDDGNYKKTISSRVRGSYHDTDIIDGEVMFGEMLDTWTLTIESELCPPH